MSEHTPGPWEQRDTPGYNDTEIWAGKVVVAKVRDGDCDGPLIAAAPDMLDALNAAQYYIGQLEAAQHGTPVRDLDEAQSAFVAANTKVRLALNHEQR